MTAANTTRRTYLSGANRTAGHACRCDTEWHLLVPRYFPWLDGEGCQLSEMGPEHPDESVIGGEEADCLGSLRVSDLATRPCLQLFHGNPDRYSQAGWP